jgi:uncharacterized membrane protein YbaN (DUF454 family)
MTASSEKNKRPLIDEIRSFRKNKIKTALMLLALGLAGLVLPVIPGMLFIILAVWLVFPDQSEKLWKRLKEALAKNK